MIVKEKIEELKLDLIQEKLSIEEIFQKHIVDGNTYFFSHVIESSIKEYKTKSLIADSLGVHIHEVIFVGSGKLGYSLNPRNLFNEFDFKYAKTKIKKDKSDIDIAIVSNSLFESISKSLFCFTDSFRNKWEKNEYYNDERLREFKVPICYKYFEYFSKGWFRPDMKPSGFDFCVKNSFQELKRTLYQEFGRSIGLGIYKDWFFFKDYHMNNLKTLHFKIKTETI